MKGGGEVIIKIEKPLTLGYSSPTFSHDKLGGIIFLFLESLKTLNKSI
jgi:hypothetical protein